MNNPHPRETPDPWLNDLMRLIRARTERRSRNVLFGLFDPKPPENFNDRLGRYRQAATHRTKEEAVRKAQGLHA